MLGQRVKQRRPAFLGAGRLLCSIAAEGIQLVRDRLAKLRRGEIEERRAECRDAFLEEEEVYLARRPANVAPGG